MKPQICAVVTGKTLPEFLKNLKKAQLLADLVELRVDYLSSPSLEMIKTIRKKVTRHSILTIRKKSEGGLFTGTEQMRRDLLLAADKLKFDYIDLEFSSVSRMSGMSRTKKIISHHNFTKTPSLSLLQAKVEQMKKHEPAVVKVATLVKNEKDVTVLLQILLTNMPHQKMMVLGMGGKGKITRILFPHLGSFCTFASVTRSQVTAPGQMTVQDLRKEFQKLTR